MRATINAVKDQMNDWTNKDGKKFKFIDGTFTSGERWSYMSTEDNGSKVQAALRELVGKEGDFDGEEKPDRDGPKFRMKTYPGKPQGTGGGFGGGRSGGSGWQAAWNQTREGEIFKNASIQAQVALKCAVELAVAGKINADVTLLHAQANLEWLSKHTPAPAEPPKPAEMPGTLTAPPAGPTPKEKAAQKVKEKVEAFEGCQTADGLVLLNQGCGEARKWLKEKGFNDLLADLDAAACRAESRFDTGSDTIPF